MVDAGSKVISTVGHTLDETGVTAKVNQFVSTAAEKTVETGVKLYHTGAEKISEIQQSNPKLAEFTEKSKSALTTVGGAITDVSTVSVNDSMLI